MIPRSRFRDIGKRMMAMTLGSAMAVTGVFSNLSLPSSTVKTEAAEEREEAYGTDIVNAAIKYLGYGYSQSSRNGANGTFDCSGLVKKVLEDTGFTNVPNDTSDWISQIQNGTLSLDYNGRLKDSVGYNGVVYVDSLEELQRLSADDSYNGYAIVSRTTISTDNLQDAGLPAGTIVVTQASGGSAAHAMIVAGDYAEQMPTGVNTTNFWSNYWMYYDQVIEEMAEDYPNMASKISSGRFVGYVSQYTYNMRNYDISQVIDWPAGTPFASRQNYWLMVNSTATANGATGVADLGGSTWVIDAASTAQGVRISNKVGGKGGATAPAYVIVPKGEGEYSASINFHKQNQNGSDVSGAVFTVYSDEACANRVATLSYSSGGNYSWTDNWSGDEITKTYYVKETTVPQGFTADTDGSGNAAMWKVELDGQHNTTTYYKRYGSSGPWTLVADGAANTYYMTVLNNQAEATVHLSVHKSDDAGNNIANVQFTIYESFNPDTGALSNALGTVTTDRNGNGSFSYELGTQIYSSQAMYIKETRVPDGYVMSEDVVYIRPIVGLVSGGVYYYGIQSAAYYEADGDGTYTQTTTNKSEVFSLAGITEVVNYPESNPTFCAGSYELSMEVENDRLTDHYAYKTVGANTSMDDITSVTYQLYRTSDGLSAPQKVGGEVTSTDKSGAQPFRVDWEDLPYYDADGNVYSYYAEETKVNGSATNLANYDVAYDGSSRYTVVTNTSRLLNGQFAIHKTNDTGTELEATFNVYSSPSCMEGSLLGSVTTTGGTGIYTLAAWNRSEGDTKTLYFKEANLDASGYVTIGGVKYKGDTNLYRVVITGASDADDSSYVIYNNATNEVVTSSPIVNHEVISHTFNKVFSGSYAKDYVDSVTVQLKRKISGGTASNVGSAVTVNKDSSGNISYTWHNLARYDSDGNEYRYFVEETAVNGSADLLDIFEVTTNNNGSAVRNTTSITNTLKTAEHTFYKAFGNTDTRNAVTSITVQLYRNGVAYRDTVVVTSSSRVGSTSWACRWDNLPQYDKDGNAYRYHVQEVSVTYKNMNGETSTLTGGDIDRYFTRSTDNAGAAALTSTTITNTLAQLYGAVTVEKVNAENDTVKIAGVKYGVYTDPDCTRLVQDYIETGSSGIAVYTVASPWYKIDGDTRTVYIKEYSTVSPYILDETIYQVVITGSTRGAEYSVCEVTADGENVGTSIKQFRQHNEEQYGRITVTKLGEVLAGFTGTTLTGDKGVITGYTNGTFTYNYEPMAGAVFALYAVGNIRNQAGTIVYTDGQLVEELITSANGTAVFEGLPIGTYRIVETKAPDGQTIPAVHEWTKTLTYAGQTQTVTTQSQTVNDNLADASVSVVKADRDTSNGLADVYFGLYAREDITNIHGSLIAEADTLISVLKTGSDGTGSFLNGAGENMDIPYGSYYIKELQTRDGYTLTDEVYEFTFAYESETAYTASFSHTFTDERMSAAISIQKVDGHTGLPVPEGDGSLDGAVYYLYAREDIIHPDGHTGVIYEAGDYVATLTTADGGKASIDHLYLGKYYVKEITPPKGYLLDDGEYDLTVVSDGVNHVETAITAYKNTEVISDETDVRDYPIARPFAIVKFSGGSSDTKLEGLNGAGFSVYLKSTLVYKEDGTIDYGASPKTVITADGKTEGFTQDVYGSDGELLYAGYFESIPIPYGEYLVHESTVPENMATVKDFTVIISEKDTDKDSQKNPVANKVSPQTYNYLFDKNFEAKIKIIKKDAETGREVALSGTVFKIYDLDNQEYIGYWDVDENSNKVFVDTFVTNSEGFVITGQVLPVGNYRIEEQLAPEGYYNSETAQGITSQFSIRIDSGFVFEGSSVDEYYDADLGCYILPVVYYDEQVKGEIEVYKEGEVLTGYDDETGRFIYTLAPLPGAEYDVYADGDICTPDHQTDEKGDRLIIYTDGQLVAHLTTGEDGKATLSGLPLGNYRIVETKAPDGYLLGEGAVQYAALVYGGQNVKVVYDSDGVENKFVNERPVADITVVKYERNEDGTVNYETRLAGTSFSFITTTDITNYRGEVIVSAGTVLATVTTGTDGTAKVDPGIGVPFGSYAFVETAVTPGYVLDATPIPVSFSYKDQHTPVIELTAEQANDYIRLEIEKTDVVTGQPVEGATLTIYKVNEDGTKGEIFTSWVTDGTAHRINRIPAGEYILEETYAPTGDGYVKAQDALFSVLETGQIQRVEMEDDFTKVEISKTDIVTGEPVKGATLTIYKVNEDGSKGEVFTSWVTGTEPHYMEYMPVGDYILEETYAPTGDGYVKAQEIEFTVLETGQIQRVEMEDDFTKVEISKTDIVTGEPVKGATLTIYKVNEDGAKGEVFTSWVTDETPHYMEYMPVGEYILEETKTPDGYQRAEDVVFTVDETGEIQKVEMKDERTYGRVEVNKVDEDGEPVAGVVFTITRQDTGEVVDTITTNENGYAVSRELPIDDRGEDGRLYSITYVMTETYAPAGVVLNPEPEEIVFCYQDDETPVVSVSCTKVNEHQEGRIAVMKKGMAVVGTKEIETEYGKVSQLVFDYVYLPGVEFTVYGDKALTEVIGTVTTDAGGYAVSGYLPVGTYYITETYTPDGYAKDDTVYEFTIEGIAQNEESIEYVLDVTKDIENHLLSSTIRIYKVGAGVDGDGVIPLEGVVFGVYAGEDITNVLGEAVVSKDARIAVIVTNERGIASMTENLPAGTYYYKELYTLDEYMLDSTPYAFEVTLEHDNVEIDVNKENPLVNHVKNASLTIHKVDQDGKPLGAGVEFTLTCTETGRTWILVTGADGTVSIDGLPIGYVGENGEWVYYTYTLKETKGLENYRLDDTVYTFSFSADSTQADAVYRSFTVKNVILGIEDMSMAGGIVMLLASLFMAVMGVKKKKEEQAEI